MSTKIKILGEQFDRALYNLLSEGELLTETDLTASDVEQIAKKTVKNYFETGRNADLENKIKGLMKDMVKHDKDFEKAVLEISRNVLVQLYKALWSKRSFWTSDLKNVNS